jgi:hypothetical protein
MIDKKRSLTPSTALLLATLTAVCAAERPAEKPNIVFILADDLSYGDLSCFGQEQFQTPNLDRLAAGGLVCRNAYAGGSWCAPSRTSLLTGLRADHWSNPHRAYPTVAGMCGKPATRLASQASGISSMTTRSCRASAGSTRCWSAIWQHIRI